MTTNLDFIVTPRRVVANGRAHAKLIVKLRDGSAPLANQPITLTVNGIAAIVPETGTTDAAGAFTATLTSTIVGTRAVTATWGASSVTRMVELTPPCDAPLLPYPPLLELQNATAADLNGDNVLDLVGTAIHGIGFASGNGDGTFQPVEITTAGNSVSARVVGDFNNDGVLDVASGTAMGSTSAVSLLLGLGDGTFGPERLMTTSVYPMDTERGDFDHDGNLDLAIASADSLGGRVGVLFGNGDGTFQPESIFGTGAMPGNTVTLLAADLDGDLDDDLVSAGLYTTSITVHVSDGARSFERADVPLGGSGGVGALVATDLDKNGHLDLALARYVPAGLTLLMGNGDATYQAPRQLAMANQGAAIIAIDFNNDTKPDLITSDTVSMRLWPGDGLGDFGVTTQLPTPAGSFNVGIRLTPGDFDNNGTIDLALEGQGTLVARGDGAGDFALPRFATAPGQSIAVGDFNNDTKPDVAIVHIENNTVLVRRGLGDGTFDAGTVYATGTNPGLVLAADLDGNTSTDLVVKNELDMTVLLNNGSGVFLSSSAVTIAGMNRHRGFALGDFNGDTRPDIAVTREPWVGAAMLQIALNNGNGTFATPTEYAIPGASYTWFLATADLRNTAMVDVVSFPLYRFAGNGSGMFGAATSIYSGGSVLNGGVVISDMDSDGKLDLLATSSGLQLHRGKGDGTFDAPVLLVDSFRIGNPVATGMINGDGLRDIVTYGDGLGVILGKSGGTYARPLFYATALGAVDNYERSIIADFNADGRADLATPGGVLIQRACTP